MKAAKLSSIFCVLVLSMATSMPSIAQKNDANEQLDSVKIKIKKQQETLEQSNQRQKEIEKQLKKDDKSIAITAAKLNKLQQQKKATNKQIATLQAEQKQLQKQKKQQEDSLGEQLRSAYSSGHHDYLKLLLNQQGPSKVERTLTYYQYLNEARINSIEDFKLTIVKLKEIELEQEVQAKKLQQLLEKQQQEKLALEKKQVSRKSTLIALNSTILSSRQRLSKLENEEISLIQTLARIQAKLQLEKQLKGLKSLKNKLSWPSKGRLTHRFGTQKQGYLKWKGVLINSNIGATVNTIHNGKVIFADWLKGYGLVIVIDHGEGYMSLYGHNQALLKNIGDRVETGEPVALVGQSGGQSSSGLYFEIRHKGKPVNPKFWCR